MGEDEGKKSMTYETLRQHTLIADEGVDTFSASVKRRIKEQAPIGLYLGDHLVARVWVKTESLDALSSDADHSTTSTSYGQAGRRMELLFMEILEEGRVTEKEIFRHLFLHEAATEIFGSFTLKDEPQTFAFLKKMEADIQEASAEAVGISAGHLFMEDVVLTFSMESKKTWERWFL